jgi:hypothetical protein
MLNLHVNNVCQVDRHSLRALLAGNVKQLQEIPLNEDLLLKI